MCIVPFIFLSLAFLKSRVAMLTCVAILLFVSFVFVSISHEMVLQLISVGLSFSVNDLGALIVIVFMCLSALAAFVRSGQVCRPSLDTTDADLTRV